MHSNNIVPDYQSLMPMVLRLAARGEVRIRDAVQELAETLKLDAQARATLLPSGRQTLFANRVHWAKTYLAKAGLIQNTRRGFFQITERGRAALQVSPDQLNNGYLSQFEEFRNFQGRSDDAQGDDMNIELGAADGKALTPDELIRLTHQQLEATLAQDLLDRIAASSPEFFERLIVNLLLAMGYGGSVTDAGRALGASGDNGIDGVIDQDPLGLDRVIFRQRDMAHITLSAQAQFATFLES
ncbi:restriction endonuclease [Paracoccus actinidiae]|uniref:winged helix-turn-helix domain-containing protein n=1 Tax=Paracoccus actinidiae TaxID=3064531 RepID=UPI0027D1F362|nr:winged helix-turn-helix domain-containing protein [Paracoccus sp. M09]